MTYHFLDVRDVEKPAVNFRVFMLTMLTDIDTSLDQFCTLSDPDIRSSQHH